MSYKFKCFIVLTFNYIDRNISLIDNSEDEVFDYFKECITRIDNDFKLPTFDIDLHKEFWSIVCYYEPDYNKSELLMQNCFLGDSYLRNNTYLLS